MPALAFLFPGQGTQTVGMGRSLADASRAARDTFEEAEEALGKSLRRLMWEGPAQELALTANAQPAITAVSVAAWRALKAEIDAVPVVAAGHSLGEYPALVCAGSLGFADALRAVRERGRLMQEAVPVGQGAMAAVVGLGPQQVEAVVAEADSAVEPVAVAAYNTPEQCTISGSREGVERAGAALRAAGAKRVLPLRVSAPFHSPLMKPVEEGLCQHLESMAIGPLACPVVSNVDAQPNAEPGRVRSLLLRQLTKPVRWVESVVAMRDLGARTFVELGPGRTLAGMVKKTDRSLTTLAVGDEESLAETAARLNA